MRLNKYLADSGVCSRRGGDKLITEGRVKVNGRTVTELGYDVNEENDTVWADGKKVAPVKKYQYYMLNKPKGCISAVTDDRGRKTVMDFIKEAEKVRLFPVGRLDYDSEGLLIITNDGDLANRLTHPKNAVPKTYTLKVEGKLENADLDPLRRGVDLGEGQKSGKAKIKILGQEERTTRIEITITEGKNREIRRMFEAVGRRVDFLKRTKIGDMKVGGLNRGEYRKLRDDEIFYLKNL